MSSKTLEFWFDYGSTYTYLSVMRIEQLANDLSITIEWKPFLVHPIMKAMGLPEGPFTPFPPKENYMWRDLERRAGLRGLPYRKPSVYPVNSLLTGRIGLVAARDGWCPEFTRQTFRGHFVEGKIIGEETSISDALNSLGRDPEQIVAAAQAPENKDALREQTEKAASIGIFGSPSFVVGGELYWGDDRLEDAMDWAMNR